MKTNPFTFLPSLRRTAGMFIAITLASATLLSSCKKDDDDDDDTDTDKTIVELNGTITGDRTLSKDTIYRLNSFVRVGTDATAAGTPSATGTLRIQEGTIIIGDRETKGTLIIQRGSKLIAEGTAAEPIVFTSERGSGLREPGDWGGIVLCGKATNNLSGGTAELEGGYGAFHGGTDDADNSGSLKYIRIEYAGVPINPNQEVNSLTMGSVGSGTTIEHIQCSYGGDDAFEWFGGTVNAKWLIAYRCLDDDFDVDNGYRGTVQFALGVRGATLADQSGSNGFEVDNDGSGSDNAPFTSAKFSNVTELGPKQVNTTTISTQFANALHLRRNSKLQIYNSFFTGYPTGLYIDGSGTTQNALDGDLVVRKVYLAGVENWGQNGYGAPGSIFTNSDTTVNPKGKPLKENSPAAGFVIADFFNTPAFGNVKLDSYLDAGLTTSAYDNADPSFLPGGSTLTSGADFSGTSGFENVAYIGAFGGSDWTADWAEFNPGAKDYGVK